MKKIISVLFIFIVVATNSTNIFAQNDTLLNKEFVFNSLGYMCVKKIGSVDTLGHYQIGKKWKSTSFYERYKWEKNKNILLVSESNDSAWVMITRLFDCIENKTVFSSKDYQNLSAKFTPEIVNKLMTGVPWIGMSEDELLFAWGKPSTINTTMLTTSVKKQYVYGSVSATYIYFTDGKLTAIQN